MTTANETTYGEPYEINGVLLQDRNGEIWNLDFRDHDGEWWSKREGCIDPCKTGICIAVKRAKPTAKWGEVARFHSTCLADAERQAVRGK